MTSDESKGQLAQDASRVATQHDDQQRAYADERDAMTEALEALLEMVRPALRAISSQVRLQGKVATWRGLVVARAEDFLPRSTSSLTKDFDALYLDDQGRWWAVDTGSGYALDIPSHKAANTWDITVIAQNICNAVDAQLTGKSAERTQAAQQRAAKLRAIVQLMSDGQS